MKIRRGWKIIWPDGTEWIGDCPIWAKQGYNAGHLVQPIMIMGAGRWPCGHQH
jgi:hypothetical protein